jgi:hypothetical protein
MQWINLVFRTKVCATFKILVIYDNDVTDAFVNTLQRLLSTPPGKTVYVALEKRWLSIYVQWQFFSLRYKNESRLIISLVCLSVWPPTNNFWTDW